MQILNLSGRTALVTGAGRRLGKAFAKALADSGANVIAHYGSSNEGAKEVVEYAESKGVRGASLQADLSDPDGAADLIDRAYSALGRVSLLVNSASIFESLSAMETSLEAWQKHMDINLASPFFLSQAFARRLEGEKGAIVNLLDWRALRPGPDHFPYTISKAGLYALTRALAGALAPNVRVNGVALGAILPPPEAGGEKTEGPIEMVPADRWGTVEEAVNTVLFLLGGPAYVTGEVIHVDGGRHLV